MDQNFNVILIQNTVISGCVLNMNEKRISVKCKSNKEICENAPVTFYIFNPSKGEMVYNGYVHSVTKDKVVISNYELIRINQKREETRVDVEIPLEIRKLILEGKNIDLEKYIPVTIINLSASGLKLKSCLDIPTQVRLDIAIPINTELIQATLEIVRKETIDHSFYYGCRMTRLLEGYKDKIRFYIFQLQVKQKS